MPRYVWREGHWVERLSGERLVRGDEPIGTPLIIGDIEPYASPVSGEIISGRAAKRDDLKRHGCIDARELTNGGLALGGKFKSRSFAEKRGMTDRLVSPEEQRD